MGVTGLWKLIEPCGTPVPVETLEGKILAIDISIWLHQVVKGFQDSNGSALAHSHLLGLFHRLCKLLYYRVKPVFVFDGCVPKLKRDTIARRQQQRSKLNNEANRIQNLLLEQLAKEQIVQKALGNAAKELIPTKRNSGKAAGRNNDDDDMFKLPDLPSTSASHNISDPSSQDGDFNITETTETSFDTTSEDSSFEEGSAKYHYQNNLQSVDVKSEHFRSLPADIRYDILLDIKETRKQSSWGRLHELPAQSDDFSGFQMKRLLKRRAVQESLEVAEQEMGGRTLTYAELQTFFKEEGLLTTSALEDAARPIACDENSRFLLVRDLKKQIKEEVELNKNNFKKKEEKQKIVEIDIKEKLIMVGQYAEPVKKSQSLDEEFDADLQLALALSLQNNDEKLYDEKDYELPEGVQPKLSKAQKQQLQDAAKGPARTYMIEYAGMNEEEVSDILEKTQTELMKNSVTQEKSVYEMISDSDSDADMVEVTDEIEITIETEKSTLANKMEILISTNKIDEDFDMFADVFKTAENSAEKILNNTADDDAKEKEMANNNELTTAENLKKAEKITKENSPEKIVNTSNDDAKQQEIAKNGKSHISQIAEKVTKYVVAAAENSPDEKQKEMASNGEGLPKDNSPEKILVNTADDYEKQKEMTSNGESQTADNLKKTEKVIMTQAPLSILEELRQQLKDVENINLDTVVANNDIIEILSDDDEFATVVQSIKSEEIIEICDNVNSCEKEKLQISPAITPRKKSQPGTPIHNKSITDFYEADYIIKRTPEKIQQEVEKHLAKVVPFFRNKTPKSKSPKNHSGSTSPTTAGAATTSKAAKKLFEDPKTITVDVLQEAANVLKQQKSDTELHKLATDLAQERRELESERNRQDRMGMSISQRMNVECQELLRLFGIPYIVAPMEAEAQCAFLDAMELTHGTITDDSDIWLFGGRTVYKNFFAQNKHVLKFSANEIESKFKCDRQALVQLACLVGSDYTTGVHGIGAVTALEILSSFSSSRTEPKSPQNIRDKINLALDTLQRFHDWWQAGKMAAVVPGSSARHALLKKLKNIEIHEGFPSMAVVEAYLQPKVDESREAFTWGQPDIESIREFARKTFGWTTTKTDEMLRPVLKRLNEKLTQKTMKNYFSTRSAVSTRQLKVSKRVQGAIERLAAGTQEGEQSPVPVKKRKPAVRRSRKGNQSKVADSADNVEKTNKKDVNAINAACSETSSAREQNTGEKIPQREKHLEQLRQNRKKAAETLKASGGPVRKKKSLK